MSGAADADWCYLVARTNPMGERHGGLSDLVVDMHSPGISVRQITDVIGNRHFCEVFFEDVRVPRSNLIGEENGSFQQIMRQMEHERGGIDRLVSNRRLYRDCLESFGQQRLEDACLRQDFATIESKYRIGRLLVLRETIGQAPRGFSAATKTFCTEFEQEVASFCGRLLGTHALLVEPQLARRVTRNISYAPGYTIMGGTTQVLRNVLAERVLGLPR